MASTELLLEKTISRLSRPFLEKATSKHRVSQFSFEQLARQIMHETNKPIFYNRTEDVSQVVENIVNLGQPAVHLFGGSDSQIDFTNYQKLLHAENSKFFIQNLNFPETKNIFLLPIGVEDMRWGRNGLPWNFLQHFRTKKKLKKVLVGPFANTHAERQECFYYASKKAITHLERSRLANWNYSRISSNYLFVACPRGNGLDTHRFWETLYRGSIPVVIDSIWSQTLSSYGLPIERLSSWDDLDRVSTHLYRRDFNYFDSYLSPRWWKMRFLQNLDAIRR